jgi:circadian clock protein KaiC
MFGLEMHLVLIYKMIRSFKPKVVVLDPITNLITVGSVSEVKSILTRLIDFLQTEQITVLFTALSFNTLINDQTDEGISSLVDAWVLIRDIELNGERNRGLYIMKSRGMKHSNQVREFVITDKGLALEDVYMGADGILTGSAREAHKIQQQTEELLAKHTLGRTNREISRKTKELDARIATLRSEYESVKEALENDFIEEELRKDVIEKNRDTLMKLRDGNFNLRSHIPTKRKKKNG